MAEFMPHFAPAVALFFLGNVLVIDANLRCACTNRSQCRSLLKTDRKFPTKYSFTGIYALRHIR